MLPALFMPMLIGGGIGALTNRKDPLKGALMGAGMGAFGGAVAPGLMGSAGGLFGGTPFNPAAASGMTNGAFLGEGVASGVGGWDGALGGSILSSGSTAAGAGSAAAVEQGGLFGKLKQASEAMKPVASTMQMGQMMGLLDGPEQAGQAPAPMTQNSGGAQTLAMLAQQGEQGMQAQLAQDAKIRRKRRMGLFGDVA
jgi:hypothetical protein